MVMLNEIVSACCGYCLELVVRETVPEMPAGSTKGIEENVIWIIHTVHPEYRLEAALVETGVVGDQRQALDKRLDFLPDIWKHLCRISIVRTQSMYSPAEPLVVFRLWMDQTVEPIGNLASAYGHDADAAHA